LPLPLRTRSPTTIARNSSIDNRHSNEPGDHRSRTRPRCRGRDKSRSRRPSAPQPSAPSADLHPGQSCRTGRRTPR
jgi:hypothetical protein